MSTGTCIECVCLYMYYIAVHSGVRIVLALVLYKIDF